MKWFCRVLAVLVFAFIWIVINDGFSLTNIILGVAMGTLSIVASNKLLGFEYATAFYLPPIKLLLYVLFMIKEIYVSGMIVTLKIITGKKNPGFVQVSINKKIRNPFLHNVIAASITLTPGTITVDNDNGKLTVLCLDAKKNGQPAKGFEEHLLGFEKSKGGKQHGR